MPGTLSVHESFAAIDPAEWDALAGDHWPYLEHAFLRGLETSGSVGGRTGWQPLPVCLRDGGRLVAAAPLYLRADSTGEFIFDWAWAEFYQRNGLRYYPKLTVAAPFTPATGPRLLVHPGAADPDRLRAQLAEAILGLAGQIGASGAHILFCQPQEAVALAATGWIHRQTAQTAWDNPGWSTFAAYLDSLRSPARKQIRKERRAIADSGLEIATVRGDRLPAEGWRALRRFYEGNAERYGAEAYLTPEFFAHLEQHLAHRVVACIAMKSGRYVAGTLSLQKGRNLFGRYWGAEVELPFLHFELAFYRLMEACIAEGWQHFEPGAGGGHKLRRGMNPVLVHSAHRLLLAPCHAAVAAHVVGETAAMTDHVASLRLQATARRDG